jgi:hypothetical protein
MLGAGQTREKGRGRTLIFESLKLSAIFSTTAAASGFVPAKVLALAAISDASSATPSIGSIALFAITYSFTSKRMRLSLSIRAISQWGAVDAYMKQKTEHIHL